MIGHISSTSEQQLAQECAERTLKLRFAFGRSRTQASEDYPLSAVPLNARKSIWSMAFMLLGFTLYSGTFFAGGLVGPAYRFWDLVGLIIVGNLILGGYAAALGYIAAKSGLSTVLMARFSFGSIGSRWVDFIQRYVMMRARMIWQKAVKIFLPLYCRAASGGETASACFITDSM